MDLENNILKYCSSVSHLELSWMYLQEAGTVDNIITNDSIINLKLSNSRIDPQSLCQLVHRLPKLKDLCIDNCAFSNAADPTDTTNPNFDEQVINNPAITSIPDTSLDTLSLNWCGKYGEDWHDQYSKLHL